MKRFFFIFPLLFGIKLFAVNVEDVMNWNELGQYNRICSNSVRDLFIKEQNDSIANLYAKACLKMDKINDLIIPIVMLYKTKDARENAALYSTILFQKKLLYLSLIDGVNISNVRTPKIDYILSEVFDKYVKNDYKRNQDKLIFKLKSGKKCELFIKNDDGIKKIVLLLYNKDNKLESIKTYW